MMPALARVRQAYEQITLPLGRICMRMGLTANMLTYLSLALSILAGYLIAQALFWWGVVGILLVGLADVLDGATARAARTAGPYGTVLDHVTDRYAEFFILGGVMLSGAVAPIWVLFALFGMIMASYVRARAESTGMIASCNVGFAGRQEKLALLILGLLAQPLLPQIRILEWAVIAVGIASHITAAQRLDYTRRKLTAADASPDPPTKSGLAG
ncbi:CDP-alcohol phosphatidyltransferase family protein [Oscillochloris sp. ZM17-4]|uniref:CDP-alcohol phosphatidyltransferase family protein n=1 Tax=Oscillochloris sp. ZM17-4 TaxID=2866714 RepID=UPI001C72AFAD|nr:CDP-alcohol phosphatidyltransferase family protein [Oscillochloris sp. ZM17-4]MBX0330443.1 CDP-alcohol phosphatidyltransferase family protein [Oscillochloris sp. ZM17-4]